jgi:methionyl-tRNA synthetase
VFGNDAKETGIPVEVWRYYLLAVRPETSDAAFQWDDFAAKNNADLNDNLGNFINRTLKFVAARYGGAVPGADPGGAGAEAAAGLGQKAAALVEQYTQGESPAARCVAALLDWVPPREGCTAQPRARRPALTLTRPPLRRRPLLRAQRSRACA